MAPQTCDYDTFRSVLCTSLSTSNGDVNARSTGFAVSNSKNSNTPAIVVMHSSLCLGVYECVCVVSLVFPCTADIYSCTC